MTLAVVTGASRGIGLAVADELRAAGFHVVRLARSLTDGSADRQTDLRCDVSDPTQVERAVTRVRGELGVPDVVVNNAGTFFIKRLEETSPKDFSELIAANLTGPFLVARAFVPAMVERGSGHLVRNGAAATSSSSPRSRARRRLPTPPSTTRASSGCAGCTK